MKLLAFALLLCIECAYPTTNSGIINDSVEEFISKLGAFKSELRNDELRTFLQQQKRKVKEQEEKNKRKILDEVEFHIFMSASCVIRDGFSTFFKKSVVNYPPCTDKTLEIPPSQIKGQVYNISDEAWLKKGYTRWISFIEQNQNDESAQCFREALSERKYTAEQMAWSAPKVWKFYNRYSHPSDSPAVVGFEKFLAITNLAKSDTVQDINNIVVSNEAEKEIFDSIRYDGKTFLDILEKRNTWYITKQDCDMINIFRFCINKKEFICKPFKLSPNLVVPLFPLGHQEPWEKECYPHV